MTSEATIRPCRSRGPRAPRLPRAALRRPGTWARGAQLGPAGRGAGRGGAPGGRPGGGRARAGHRRGERGDPQRLPADGPAPGRRARPADGRPTCAAPTRSSRWCPATPRTSVALLAERGLTRADAVICGLPWALFDEPTQQAILDQVSQVIGTHRRVHHVRLPARHDAGRGPAVPGRPAGDVRRGGGQRHGLAQHAARVRLRLPAPAAVPAPDPVRPDWAPPPVSARLPRRCRPARCCGWPRRRCRCWPPSRSTCWSTRRWSGRLGAVPLAGLAVAAVLFAQVTSQLTFLSYGTTARTARLHGAGRRADAVAEGVQATWLALAVGLLVLVVGQLVAGPVAGRSAPSRTSRPGPRLAAGGAVRGAAGAGHAGRQRLDARRAGHRAAAAVRAGRQRRCPRWPARRWCTGSAAGPGWAWSARRWPT